MWLRLAKRRNVSGPPCRGGGSPRTRYAGGAASAGRSGDAVGTVGVCIGRAKCYCGTPCQKHPPMPPEGTLAERLLRGDKRALARAISLVEDDEPEGWEVVREVYPKTGKAAIIGLTGPPGAGKST